ncbi:MAG: thioredoxin family protein [Bacteroidetes bacterium]|nr:thioredoxin family protein [Bacteroidota bacterium]
MAVTLVTDKDFKESITQNSKVVIKYYADWCGSCKLFSPKFRRLSEDERFKGITFINVNAEENEEARKFTGVDNLPFFATVKDGQLFEGSATSKEEYLVGMLEKLAEGS